MNEGSYIDRIDQFSKAGPFQPKELLKPLLAKSESVVLDIGTGSGLWALEAARLGAKDLIALDKSSEQVSYLTRRASSVLLMSGPSLGLRRNYPWLLRRLMW